MPNISENQIEVLNLSIFYVTPEQVGTMAVLLERTSF